MVGKRIRRVWFMIEKLLVLGKSCLWVPETSPGYQKMSGEEGFGI